MSGDSLNGFRKDELKKTNREVLEIPQIDRMQSKHNSATCISAPFYSGVEKTLNSAMLAFNILHI